MSTRDVSTIALPRDVVLQGSPNWTAVIFFGVLSALHLSVALPAFARARWEGSTSLLFAAAFVGITVVSYLARSEISIQPLQKRIRVRNGLRRLHFQRFIAFSDVHGVRLTLSNPGGSESRIELLCDNEDIECPPTRIPRQEALCLAVLIGVRLIKVLPDGFIEPEPSERF